MTILRVLSIENETVKRAIINDAQIEKTLLVTERREGDAIMTMPQHQRLNVMACYTQDVSRVGGIVGGKQVQTVRIHTGPPRLTRDLVSLLEHVPFSGRCRPQN
jgi:hypothetical protein